MVVAINFEIKANLVTKRSHGQIMRQVNRGMLERWRDRFLPLHFEGGATQRYGYRPRSGRYLARKRRMVGHGIPLVLTGRLRDTIRRGVVIRATQHRGTARSRGYFPMRNEMRGEIERITDAERRDLIEWGLAEYLRLAKRPEHKRRSRARNARGHFV
jgi:hypothetical protein